MGSTASVGWSRQTEDAAAQCDSLCSAASTVSSLCMLLCDGRDSSVSSTSRKKMRLLAFSWESVQDDDSFGSKINGLQSRTGQQRSHPYGKSVLAAMASLPTAVQSFDNMKSLHYHVPLLLELERRRGYSKTVLQFCFF